MIAMAKATTQSRPCGQPLWHSRFLDMVPTIRSYARAAFRNLRPDLKDERIAEVVANTLVAYRRLVDQGKENLAYATVLARFGIAQVRAGRRVGSRFSCKDVLSQQAQRRGSFRVERFDEVDGGAGDWKQLAVEDRRCRPADIAALRIDFAAWLDELPPRKRRIARKLAYGESTNYVAKLFHTSAARISQIRAELHQGWLCFQGELATALPAPRAAA